MNSGASSASTPALASAAVPKTSSTAASSSTFSVASPGPSRHRPALKRSKPPTRQGGVSRASAATSSTPVSRPSAPVVWVFLPDALSCTPHTATTSPTSTTAASASSNATCAPLKENAPAREVLLDSEKRLPASFPQWWPARVVDPSSLPSSRVDSVSRPPSRLVVRFLHLPPHEQSLVLRTHTRPFVNDAFHLTQWNQVSKTVRPQLTEALRDAWQLVISTLPLTPVPVEFSYLKTEPTARRSFRKPTPEIKVKGGGKKDGTIDESAVNIVQRKRPRRQQMPQQSPHKGKEQPSAIDLNTSDDSFAVGTVLWALLDGYPWWPCRVIPIVDIPEMPSGPPLVPPTHVLVMFFNDNNRWCVMDKGKTCAFRRDAFYEQRSRTRNRYSKAISVALEEAWFFIMSNGTIHRHMPPRGGNNDDGSDVVGGVPGMKSNPMNPRPAKRARSGQLSQATSGEGKPSTARRSKQQQQRLSAASPTSALSSTSRGVRLAAKSPIASLPKVTVKVMSEDAGQGRVSVKGEVKDMGPQGTRRTRSSGDGDGVGVVVPFADVPLRKRVLVAKVEGEESVRDFGDLRTKLGYRGVTGIDAKKMTDVEGGARRSLRSSSQGVVLKVAGPRASGIVGLVGSTGDNKVSPVVSPLGKENQVTKSGSHAPAVVNVKGPSLIIGKSDGSNKGHGTNANTEAPCSRTSEFSKPDANNGKVEGIPSVRAVPVNSSLKLVIGSSSYEKNGDDNGLGPQVVDIEKTNVVNGKKQAKASTSIRQKTSANNAQKDRKENGALKCIHTMGEGMISRPVIDDTVVRDSCEVTNSGVGLSALKHGLGGPKRPVISDGGIAVMSEHREAATPAKVYVGGAKIGDVLSLKPSRSLRSAASVMQFEQGTGVVASCANSSQQVVGTIDSRSGLQQPGAGGEMDYKDNYVGGAGSINKSVSEKGDAFDGTPLTKKGSREVEADVTWKDSDLCGSREGHNVDSSKVGILRNRSLLGKPNLRMTELLDNGNAALVAKNVESASAKMHIADVSHGKDVSAGHEGPTARQLCELSANLPVAAISNNAKAQKDVQNAAVERVTSSAVRVGATCSDLARAKSGANDGNGSLGGAGEAKRERTERIGDEVDGEECGWSGARGKDSITNQRELKWRRREAEMHKAQFELVRCIRKALTMCLDGVDAYEKALRAIREDSEGGRTSDST